MDIQTIIKDAIERFKETNNPFWENDDELSSVFQSSDAKMESGADIFSLISGLLNDTSVYFKNIGIVSSKLWKPMLTKIEGKVMAKIKDDYELGIAEYKKKYPAPLPATMQTAEEYLQKLRELCPIKEAMNDLSVEDTEATSFIRTMASDYMKNLLSLFAPINDEMSDTLYMTGIQGMEIYKGLVAEAFDIIISFCIPMDTSVTFLE